MDKNEKNPAMPALPGHPEPFAMAWTELELREIEEYGVACWNAGQASASVAFDLSNIACWLLDADGSLCQAVEKAADIKYPDNAFIRLSTLLAAAPTEIPAQSGTDALEHDLLSVIIDGVPLTEPVRISKAMLAQHPATVVLDKGVGPVAAVHLVNISLTGWVHNPEMAKAYAEGFNKGTALLRKSLIDYADRAAPIAASAEQQDTILPGFVASTPQELEATLDRIIAQQGDGELPQGEDRSKWTLKQWYEHVGAWEDERDCVCFGSVMALRAMLVHMANARSALAQRAGSAKPPEQAEAQGKPAVTVDTPELRTALGQWAAWYVNGMGSIPDQKLIEIFVRLDAWQRSVTARAVAEALEGQLTEMGPGGALYLPQAWPDAWHALRDDVLSGVDGLDNDQINIVLGMLDNYEPVAAIQPSQPVGAVQVGVTPREMAIAQAIRQKCSQAFRSSWAAYNSALGAIDLATVIRDLAPPAAVQSDTELPPLPACDLISYEPHGMPDCYSANKMRAYGQVCHAMGRGAAVREYVANGTFKQLDSERDAARYRFLRKGFGDMGPDVDMHNAFVDGDEKMDATIDAAMAAQQGEKGGA